ncbi:MarR family winged helix-turn-helix transcriptional regulator [Nonomuraea africana]|uniref:DNA-binding MarR family transcriptional regulator n=1 Tax=Nonomuraea africana TaxID=46171 RepID=A0ABR9KIF0_9ACTN|nr:MarR family transcriptional regulator [Nonomuraea africana]MBE1561797.1 DNA-binding MarR family transcriptional regulator [Nonomuraea africana]
MNDHSELGHLDPATGAAVEGAAAALIAVWAYSRQSAATKVSSIQLQALLTIERHQQVNLAGLGQALGALPSSTSRLCDRLEATGWVRRSVSPDDRRELTIGLTPAGKALLEELRAQRRADLAQVVDEMPPEARKALLRGLRAFTAAADRVTEQRIDRSDDTWTLIAGRFLA